MEHAPKSNDRPARSHTQPINPKEKNKRQGTCCLPLHRYHSFNRELLLNIAIVVNMKVFLSSSLLFWLAPIAIQAQEFVCPMCGEGRIPTLLDVEVDVPTQGIFTCEEIDIATKTGVPLVVDENLCPLLQAFIEDPAALGVVAPADPCGCVATEVPTIIVTDFPSEYPSSFPSSSPTTATPTSSPTGAPTRFPTTAMPTVGMGTDQPVF